MFIFASAGDIVMRRWRERTGIAVSPTLKLAKQYILWYGHNHETTISAVNLVKAEKAAIDSWVSSVKAGGANSLFVLGSVDDAGCYFRVIDEVITVKSIELIRIASNVKRDLIKERLGKQICHMAAPAVTKVLVAAGFDARTVKGAYLSDGHKTSLSTHYWTEADGYLVDVTLDQLGREFPQVNVLRVGNAKGYFHEKDMSLFLKKVIDTSPPWPPEDFVYEKSRTHGLS